MGGGKSYLLRWAALLYAIILWKKTGIEGIPIGLFSEDYPTLKDRQISRIAREFPKELGELKETKNEGNCFFISPNLGGGRILLRNLDDPSKYMSTEFACEFVEELTRVPEQTFLDLRNRLRYPGIDEVKFMGASNPGGVGHVWVKKLFVDQNTDDVEQDRFFYVHATVQDNKYVSPEYVKQLKSLPENMRKAYLDGSWDVFAGQFFDEWNTALHVVRPFIPHKSQMIVGGMDYGWTAPTAVYFATVDKEYFESKPFFRVRVFAEVYGTRKSPKEWAYEIKQQLKFFKLELKDVSWIRADPAIFKKKEDGSIGIADMFRQERIHLIPADNDRQEGAQMFHNWLSLAPDGEPYLQFGRNCENAITTIPSLIYDKNEKKQDVDTKGDDHSYDSIRYMLRHIKWVQPKGLGPINQNVVTHYKKPMAWMVGGRQVSLDLTKFQNVHKKSTKVIASSDIMK